jgi:5-methylcytosine-specific restriction endonuclease McrA
MSEVKCPYCGKINGNLWEWQMEKREVYKGDYECGHCDRVFKLSRIVSVDYEASPIDKNGGVG